MTVLKFISAFLTGIWIGAAIFAFMGLLSPILAGTACLLAAMYNFENIFK